MTDTNVRTAPTPEMLDDLPLIQRRDGWIRCAKQTGVADPRRRGGGISRAGPTCRVGGPGTVSQMVTGDAPQPHPCKESSL